VQFEDFDILRKLGKGGFASVYLVCFKNHRDRLFAMKVMSKDHIAKNKQIEHIMTERNILAKTKSPFIVDMQYAFQTDEKLFFVMEFVQGGNLDGYVRILHYNKQLQKKAEEIIILWAAEIIVALEHLHQLGIVYRDLKPENLLVDHEGHVKITDFGLSKWQESGSDLTYTSCGTPEYVAPEVLGPQGHNHMIDWWSFGILLFEVYVGVTPFRNMTVQRILKKLMSPEPIDLSMMSKAPHRF
jgi:serine/threonine protein kinase